MRGLTWRWPVGSRPTLCRRTTFDTHRAGLEGSGERGLVAGVERPLCRVGGGRFLDLPHDGAARCEPFARYLAARKLAGLQKIVDRVCGDGEQSRDAVHVQNVRLGRRMSSAMLSFCWVFHRRLMPCCSWIFGLLPEAPCPVNVLFL